MKSNLKHSEEGLLTITLSLLFTAILKNLLPNFIIYYFVINNFYDVNLNDIYKPLLYSKFYTSNLTMTGIRSISTEHFIPLLSNSSIRTVPISKYNGIWTLAAKIAENNVFTLLIIFGLLTLSLMTYINLKIYFKKRKYKVYKKCKNNYFLGHLLLLTIFKCIIIEIILLSFLEKHRAIKIPNKIISKNYFFSIQYFDDTYHSMELQTKSLHEMQCLTLNLNLTIHFFKF